MNHPLGSQLSDYSSLALGAAVGLVGFLAAMWNIRRKKREIAARNAARHDTLTKA